MLLGGTRAANIRNKNYLYQILSQMGRRRILLLLILLSSLMLLCLHFVIKTGGKLLAEQTTVETFTVLNRLPLKTLYLRYNNSKMIKIDHLSSAEVPQVEKEFKKEAVPLPVPQLLSERVFVSGHERRQWKDSVEPQKYSSGGAEASRPTNHTLLSKRGTLKTYGQQLLQNTTEDIAEYKYIPAMRLVHFDLKGAPPLVSYFKELFPIIKKAGANGILIEYEDTFPYWGPLAPTAAENAYSKKDIEDIIKSATSNGLEVIPLVQTFGHLEYVLKLQQFQHIREVEIFPQALCPRNNDSFDLVRNIIDQVLSLHPQSKWLHIGCDEVYHLGMCHRCEPYQHSDLFLSHVSKVARYVKETHKVKPIMWDDMLRHIEVEKLNEYQMGSLVEPMVWTYVKNIYMFVPDTLWEKYRQIFPILWTASAFKGAFGETLKVPSARLHLENNIAWLQVMEEQSNKHQMFRGIALTGWQRYDHMAALCELLPAGIPSLVLNLLTMKQGFFTKDLYATFQDLLSCYSRAHHRLDLTGDPNMWDAAGVCFFPGSPVFRLTQHYHYVSKNVEAYIHDVTVHKGWLTSYNVRHNFSSPMRIDELMKHFSTHNSSLTSLTNAARSALRSVYDEYTVLEWIEQNIYPYIKTMRGIWEGALRMRKFKTWPKRPLPLSEEVIRVVNGTK